MGYYMSGVTVLFCDPQHKRASRTVYHKAVCSALREGDTVNEAPPGPLRSLQYFHPGRHFPAFGQGGPTAFDDSKE